MKFKPLNPKIVLGVGAHPDDLDFMAGGAMAKFAASGAKVYYLVVTDGSKGDDNQNIEPEHLATIRREEQKQALKILGGEEVFFLNYSDAELEVSLLLKKDIVKIVRTIRPDVVITFDPSMIYSAEQGLINHPDHRAVGQATLDAIYPLARDHLALPELIGQNCLPHATPTVLLFNFDKSNFCVDITDTFDKKIAALKAHKSQKKNITEMTQQVRRVGEEAGKKLGCDLAESFVRIDIRY